MPLKPKRVLVTGFDAFDNLQSNPSQEIVESLPPALKLPGRSNEVTIDTLVLPTCCTRGWSKLKRKLDAKQNTYDAVVMTGVAAVRHKIHLERFALNIRDYRIKDNSGHIFRDLPIEKGAPEALKTGLPVAEMCNKLEKLGIICDVSNFAGAFICNEIYYKCLFYQQDQRKPSQVLFVHLPLPRTYKKSMRELKLTNSRLRGTGIDLMTKAVEKIIELSLTPA